jgi:hypothetical protein
MVLRNEDKVAIKEDVPEIRMKNEQLDFIKCLKYNLLQKILKVLEYTIKLSQEQNTFLQSVLVVQNFVLLLSRSSR